MIIGACGFGSTGSSAISDYLLEYGNVQVLDQIEFTWVSGVNGLVDMEYHLMHPHGRTMDSITAIRNYSKRAQRLERTYVKYGGIPKDAYYESIQKFLDSIAQVSWNWYSFEDKNLFDKHLQRVLRKRIIPSIEKKVGHQINCYPMEKVYLSVAPDNFYEAARLHVRELLEGMGADYSNKMIVLDQPFAGNNPQAAFPFFDDPYAIIVDRDPRDNYVFAKTRLLGRNHFMAIDNVQDFVKYFRAIRDNQPYQQKDKRVLSIKFEDMVYKYDETTAVIRKFLDLGENPAPRSVFDPTMSINNTQVFRRFPQYADDVKYIEDHLTDYLFDYDEYKDIEITGEMFFGKSPLHK